MGKMGLAKKLAEMTQSMDEARAERNSKVTKIYQTNPQGREMLKTILNYCEPCLEERDA